MARADEQLAAGVIVYGAAGVGAGSVVSNELPVIEPHEDTGVPVGGQGKIDGTVVLYLADLGNSRA